MKTVLFISSNKVLGQGLSAAIHAKPELDFLWAAQLHYPQAVVGVDIFHADVVILDIVDQADMDRRIWIRRSGSANLFGRLNRTSRSCFWSGRNSLPYAAVS